ncbi:MAG: CBS domain-containing protein [Acidobacteria bacterium]|nr:CBS domain-containing protein [Acidobacteriota bacterium]
MKVSHLMNDEVRVCALESNLADAAGVMWEGDCGVLPVINADHQVVGMLTDRDIAIATATKGRPATEISVAEVVNRPVSSCHVDDEIQTALKTMRHEKIRRLPVLNDEGRLQGILTINDVVLAAEEPGGKHIPEVTYEDAMSTLKAMSEHLPHHVELAPKAKAAIYAA